jgi:hypothetical protein
MSGLNGFKDAFRHLIERKLEDRNVLFILLIIVASFLIFFPQKQMGFTLDAHHVIKNNPLIKNPDLYPQIFSSSFFEPTGTVRKAQFNYYRPLLVTSFALDYKLWGPNPFAYRIVNILLHIGNCLLLFFVLKMILAEIYANKAFSIAAAASFLFCILPVNEWVVRYVVGRGDLLQAFFILLSILLTSFYVQKRMSIYLTLGIAMFIASLLTRETSVLYPFYAGLAVFVMTRDIRKTFKIVGVYAVFSVFYYFARQFFLPINTAGTGRILTDVFDGLVLAAVQFTHLVLPAVVQARLPDFMPSIIVSLLILLAWLAIRSQKEKNDSEGPVFFAALLWTVSLLPSFIAARDIAIRIGPVLAEHFLYIPSMGFVLLIGLFYNKLRSSKNVFLFWVVFFFVTVQLFNGNFWRDEETLLRHVASLEKEPHISREQIVMRFEDNIEDAKLFFERAPTDKVKSTWAKRIGNIYRRKGDYPKAMAAFETALSHNPHNVSALNEMGVSFLENGYYEEGKRLLERSLSIDPQHAETYLLLGTMHLNNDDLAAAERMFKKAEYYNPQK